MTKLEPENSRQRTPSLRDLFPDLSDEQLKEVEDTFHGYLEIAWRIYERLERERPEFFDTLKGSS
jgi:hypothetical protein